MNVWEGVLLAFDQLRSEKLKSVFSLLGVVVGVMFLILVVSVVEGMDRYIREDFAGAINGVNTVTVRRTSADFTQDPGQRRARETEAETRERLRRPPIRYEEFEIVRDRLTTPGAQAGATSIYTGTVVGDNGNQAFGVYALAVSPELFEIRDWQVTRGRQFSPQEAEAGADVVVLGSQSAEVIFEGADPIGRTVRLRGAPFRVVGVLEPQGSLFGRTFDNLLIAPFKSSIVANNGPRAELREIIVQADDPAQIPILRAEVEGILRAYRGLHPSENSDFAVDTAESTISTWNTLSRILFTALPAIVGVALFVGGIVIMNIMLVSVMERTREIGIRKAVGARRRDILLQIIVEASTLSAFGAVAGVGFAVGIVTLLAALTPLPAAIDAVWVSVGVGLGIAVGVVAGVYPALRASRMHPVDALRYE